MSNVPKMRFPDFQDTKEWEQKTLTELADRITKKNKDGLVTRVLTNSAVDGIVDQRDYFDKDIANQNNLNGYLIVDKGDYVYNPRISNVAPVGPISKNKIGKGVMSPLYTVFRYKNSSNTFYEHYFKSTHWYQYLRMVSNSGARHDRMSIGINDFDEMPLPYPLPKEQQKISDCLSSIDELISIQSQKYDALKDYKKGLMQQLFPIEGETVPKLRFSEFRNKGKWKIKELGGNLRSHPEYGLNAPAVPFSTKLPKYLRITDISEEGNYIHKNKVSVAVDITKDNYLKEGDVVIARTGASVGKSYKYFKEDGELIFAGFLIRVRPDPRKLVSGFLFQYLFTDQYWHWVSITSPRGGQPGINGNEYASLMIPFPPSLEEQKKISVNLKAIDELVNSQLQKIKSLKTHKKGLMQKLFPLCDDENV